MSAVRAWGSGNDYVIEDDKILWNFQWIVGTVIQNTNVLKANDLLITELILDVDKRQPDIPMVGMQISPLHHGSQCGIPPDN